MSLLADLINHMPPSVSQVSGPPMEKRTRTRPHLVTVAPEQMPARKFIHADNATPEWRQARDRYINHVMTCRGCYAPGRRYCRNGAELSAIYERTPMEADT